MSFIYYNKKFCISITCVVTFVRTFSLCNFVFFYSENPTLSSILYNICIQLLIFYMCYKSIDYIKASYKKEFNRINIELFNKNYDFYQFLSCLVFMFPITIISFAIVNIPITIFIDEYIDTKYVFLFRYFLFFFLDPTIFFLLCFFIISYYLLSINKKYKPLDILEEKNKIKKIIDNIVINIFNVNDYSINQIINVFENKHNKLVYLNKKDIKIIIEQQKKFKKQQEEIRKREEKIRNQQKFEEFRRKQEIKKKELEKHNNIGKLIVNGISVKQIAKKQSIYINKIINRIKNFKIPDNFNTVENCLILINYYKLLNVKVFDLSKFIPIDENCDYYEKYVNLVNEYFKKEYEILTNKYYSTIENKKIKINENYVGISFRYINEITYNIKILKNTNLMLIDGIPTKFIKNDLLNKINVYLTNSYPEKIIYNKDIHKYDMFENDNFDNNIKKQKNSFDENTKIKLKNLNKFIQYHTINYKFVPNKSKRNTIFNNFDKNRKRYFDKEDIQDVYTLQNKKCKICDFSIEYNETEKDHIRPYSFGGNSIKSNLQILCKFCHRKKTNFENNLKDRGYMWK